MSYDVQFSSDFLLTLNRKKRSTNAENVTVTFADVAGVDSAKLELAEVVGVMKVRQSDNSYFRHRMNQLCMCHTGFKEHLLKA